MLPVRGLTQVRHAGAHWSARGSAARFVAKIQGPGIARTEPFNPQRIGGDESSLGGVVVPVAHVVDPAVAADRIN